MSDDECQQAIDAMHAADRDETCLVHLPTDCPRSGD